VHSTVLCSGWLAFSIDLLSVGTESFRGHFELIIAVSLTILPLEVSLLRKRKDKFWKEHLVADNKDCS
jgi:hypothetical protein